jgi:hypothetical protein
LADTPIIAAASPAEERRIEWLRYYAGEAFVAIQASSRDLKVSTSDLVRVLSDIWDDIEKQRRSVDG